MKIPLLSFCYSCRYWPAPILHSCLGEIDVLHSWCLLGSEHHISQVVLASIEERADIGGPTAWTQKGHHMRCQRRQWDLHMAAERGSQEDNAGFGGHVNWGQPKIRSERGTWSSSEVPLWSFAVLFLINKISVHFPPEDTSGSQKRSVLGEGKSPLRQLSPLDYFILWYLLFKWQSLHFGSLIIFLSVTVDTKTNAARSQTERKISCEAWKCTNRRREQIEHRSVNCCSFTIQSQTRDSKVT